MREKDVVFSRAHIVPGDGSRCDASALAVRDGRIAFMGSDDDARRLFPDARRIDCAGRSLLPGFIDAHNHVTLLGASLRAVSFHYPDVSCARDVLDRVREAAAGRAPGTWVRGWGLDHGKFPDGRLPSLAELDAVSPDHPVCIVHYTGHNVLVNSVALRLCGVNDATPDPEGGRFERDADGRLTGYALDAAQQLVVPSSVRVGHHGPDIGYDTPHEEFVADIAAASQALLAVGVTTVVEPQATTREMQGLLYAREEGRLGVRTVCMPLSNHLDALLELGLVRPLGDGMLAIGPVKYYMDGSLVGGTAAFNEPHCNREPDYRGSLYWDAEAMFASIRRAHAAGLQIGIHTQGDRAHDIVLDIIDRVLTEFPQEDARFRLEHSGYPLPRHIDLMARHGVIPVTQPGQLYEAGDNLHDNYGPERARRMYPLRSFLRAGLRPAISSDAFVQSCNPLHTIRGAVLRRSLGGRDMGQDECISPLEAITCHTLNAARSCFREGLTGSLAPGKLADIILLDRDILAAGREEIANMRVLLTMLGGRIVHEAE